MAKVDYYELLEVERSVDERSLKKAYRKKAMEFHPDRNPDDPAAEEKFKLVSEAYSVLSDPSKRRIYDQFGHAGLERGGMGPGFGDVGDIFSHFQDIFGDMFGGFGGFGGRRANPNAPARGADIRATLELTLVEAAYGAEKELELTHPDPCEECDGTGAEGGDFDTCGTCGGRGQVASRRGAFVMSSACPSCRGQGMSAKEPCDACHGRGEVDIDRKVKITVPPGVDTGQTLRLSGQGQSGRRGGPAGHLYATVVVEPHELFERHGADLFHELHISFPQAALGDKVHVPALDPEASSPTTVKVPSGIQPGETVKVKGAGIARLDGRGKGDLVCVVQIDVPKKLSRKAKKLLQDLAQSLEG